MTRWTEELEERLIDLVKGYSWLYDVKNKSYWDKHKKSNSWQEIANTLGADIDVEAARKKWDALRDRYRRLRRMKLEPSGSSLEEAESEKIAWPPYSVLDSFMQQHTNHRPRGGDSFNVDSVTVQHGNAETLLDAGTCKAIPVGPEPLVDSGDGYARELNTNMQPVGETSSVAPPFTESSGDSVLHCTHCDYACLRQDRLDWHVKRRHGHIGRNGRFRCDWCEYSTNQKSCMTSHKRKHTGERPFSCDDCGKAFTERGNLTAHSRTHSGHRPHVCDVCGKAFKLRNALSRHKETHIGEVVHQRKLCDVAVSGVANNTRHFKARDEVKAYRCQVCPARFSKRPHLIVHNRTHTGERPYGCSFCPARFATDSARTGHVIAKHTHDYRHRCGRCGKGFVNPKGRRRHEDKCTLTDALLICKPEAEERI